MNHAAQLLGYLELRSPTAEDRRAALLSAIETAATTDKGVPIASAIIVTFRERQVLLPVANMIERMGLAARAIARRRAEAALISDLDRKSCKHWTGCWTSTRRSGRRAFTGCVRLRMHREWPIWSD